jgi:hypothetical protein
MATRKPEQITPILEVVRGNTCMCMYSIPGVGKTRLIGQGSGKTLILHPPTDHMDSIRSGRAEEWTMRDWDDMDRALDYARSCKPGEWDWWWLDSVSLFQDHGLDDIWANVLAEKPLRIKHGIDKGEYGVNMHRLGQWFRHMVGQAKDYQTFNFGFTAHQAETYGPDGETMMLMPWVQGKNMPAKLCGYMNIVAYLEIKGDKRVLRTRATETYYAKDQYDAWANGRVVEPTMDKIDAAIAAARPKALAKAEAASKAADEPEPRRRRRRRA